MFESRLMALSRAHDVLTNESWEGANLDEIVAQAITPYRGGDVNRFRIDGPPVRLSAKMALSISMALHELATNAAKYGALSNDRGPREHHLADQARSRPLVAPARMVGSRWPAGRPARSTRCIGTRLIERGLAQELGGDTKIEYRPSGVWCEMNARLTR